jgi:hypothetical protein
MQVGLSFRYHDQTLAFINAHFAADKKGRSGTLKRVKVGKKRVVGGWVLAMVGGRLIIITTIIGSPPPVRLIDRATPRPFFSLK